MNRGVSEESREALGDDTAAAVAERAVVAIAARHGEMFSPQQGHMRRTPVSSPDTAVAVSLNCGGEALRRRWRISPRGLCAGDPDAV
jgi:hypothetical protein